jgi:RNA polymerase sigma factor (sigma-70 family)
MVEDSWPTIRNEASQDDDQLVQACLKGREKAWDTLIDKYKNLIFSIPIKYRLPADDADDIFQEVCLDLFRELPRLRTPRALAAWLIQTTSHKCFHRKRERQRYAPTISDGSLNSVGEADVPEDLVHEVEREQMLREALSAVPPRCREIIRMLFFQEPVVPYEEVAKNLAVAKGSIGFLRMRCLEHLRRLLEKQGLR